MNRLNRQRIASSFAKSASTYADQACVQKQMASTLCQYLVDCLKSEQSKSNNQQHNILELGCGTGFLTKKLCEQLVINQLFTNDIHSQTQLLIEDITKQHQVNHQFILGDALSIKTTQLSHLSDIITANALLQWIEDKPNFFKQLHQLTNINAILAFSSFNAPHFHEVKSITGVGINYPSIETLKKMAMPFFKLESYKTEKTTLYFDTPLAILKHIKQTGVNSIQTNHWVKKDLNQFIEQYQRFKTSKGFSLSYHPCYLIFKKNN